MILKLDTVFLETQNYEYINYEYTKTMDYCVIFHEYINFDPSSPFNQLRFSPLYDAILVGGSYVAHPWGVLCGPPCI